MEIHHIKVDNLVVDMLPRAGSNIYFGGRNVRWGGVMTLGHNVYFTVCVICAVDPPCLRVVLYPLLCFTFLLSCRWGVAVDWMGD